jgi:RHS repeat-associated protein
VSGANAGRPRHDPFGNRITRDAAGTWDVRLSGAPPVPQGLSATTVGYTGHEQEDDLGLVNMRGRIYDARLARFMQMDPLVMNDASVGGVNRYSYVKNNPIRFTDPTGFAWTDCSVYDNSGELKEQRSCNTPDDPDRHRFLVGVEATLNEMEREYEGAVEAYRQRLLQKRDAETAAAAKANDYILKPNFDMKKQYDWHYSRNSIVINALPKGMSQAQAMALVRGDFSRFASFDRGNIASVRVLGGGVAGFHLKGGKGFSSSAFNDMYAMVQLTNRGGVQAAFTAGNHQLQGIRTWNVTALSSGGIQITTEAYERPNGFLNAVGSVFLDSESDQRRVWDTYLGNIDQNYFGGNGALLPMQTGLTGPMTNPLAGLF